MIVLSTLDLKKGQLNAHGSMPGLASDTGVVICLLVKLRGQNTLTRVWKVSSP